jgi:hypothetical protein
MSFGFRVGDFLVAGSLTLKLYRSLKDAPREFQKIDNQLSAFHIIICDLKDQADDPKSLLNRHGAARREDLIEMVRNIVNTLPKLEDLYGKYQQIGKNP